MKIDAITKEHKSEAAEGFLYEYHKDGEPLLQITTDGEVLIGGIIMDSDDLLAVASFVVTMEREQCQYQLTETEVSNG